MKNRDDLAQGLLKKAAHDWAAAQYNLEGGFFAIACFLAQQCAEKYLKAYLVTRDINYEHIHDLRKLLVPCIALDASFSQLLDDALALVPYAVEVRYDIELWPTREEAGVAVGSARRIRVFVIERLPAALGPERHA